MASAELLTRLRVQAWDAEHLGHWQIANTLRDVAKVLANRHQIVSDNDGHHYIIPTDRAGLWEIWLTLPVDDERSDEPPYFARRVEGYLTFLDPNC